MTDRERSLRDLLAEELADDWQPHSIRTNRLSYRERQQLKDGPDADFIEENMEGARCGRKRSSIVAGVGIALCVLFPLLLFEGSDWETLANVLWICVSLGLTSFGALRHMHWRKRAMIYRAFRLMNAEHESAPNTNETAIAA